MTTGRINQVTIVAPVKANRPYFRAEEFSSYWVGGRGGPRGRAARPAFAGLAAGHICFPLLNSPERRRQARAGGVSTPRRHRLGAPRGGPTGRFSPVASPTGRYPRWLCRGLANRQAPTEPTPRHTRGIPLRLKGVFPDAAPARRSRPPGRPRDWGGARRNRRYPGRP